MDVASVQENETELPVIILRRKYHLYTGQVYNVAQLLLTLTQKIAQAKAPGYSLVGQVE